MATLVVRDWPDDLHRELKKAAIDHGLTLKDILQDAAQTWLKAKRKK